MLDTVRFRLKGNYWDGCSGMRSEAPEGWIFKEYVAFDEFGQGRLVRNAQHVETDLRITGSTTDADMAEVSLPRVLHGHNGVLLSTREELAEAWQGLMGLVGEVVQAPRVEHFTRLDLVWQFEANPEDWINGLRRAKHPRVRKAAHEFFGESLHWPGKEVHLRLYDKGKEANKQPGKVARFEVQLRGGALSRAMGDGRRVEVAQVLDFKRGYQAYREFLVGFERRTLIKPKGLAEFFVYCDSQGWIDCHGRNALDVYCSNRSVRTRQRLMREVYRASKSGHQAVVIDFEARLPVDHPPAAVNVA